MLQASHNAYSYSGAGSQKKKKREKKSAHRDENNFEQKNVANSSESHKRWFKIQKVIAKVKIAVTIVHLQIASEETSECCSQILMYILRHSHTRVLREPGICVINPI